MIKLIRVLLVAVIGMSAALGTAVAQKTQSPTEVTSEVGSHEFVLKDGSNGEFLHEQYSIRQFPGNTEEYIWFTNNSANYEVVLVENKDQTAESYSEITLGNMEDFYDSWELVEQKTDDQTGMFIGHATYGDHPLIVFYYYQQGLFDGVSVVYMQFSSPNYFASDLEWAQENFSVDGENILADLDAAELESVAEGDAAPTEEATAESGTTRTSPRDRVKRTTATEEPTEEATEEATSEATKRAGRTTRGTSETPEATAGTIDSRWADLGVVSDSEWESPQYGTTITWDTSTWVFPNDFDRAVIVNEERKYDTLTLETVDNLGYVFVTIDTAEGLTTEGLVEWYTSAEYAETWNNPIEILDSKVTDTTASVVILTTNNRDQDLLVIMDFELLDDGTGVWSQISAAPDKLGEVLDRYSTGVQANGEPINLSWTPEEIDALGAN